MSRHTGPNCRFCRREGAKLFLKGERCLTDKCGVERRSYPPGEHGRTARRKESDYAVRLREKQRLRAQYGLREKQMTSTYAEAKKEQEAKERREAHLRSLQLADH